MPPADYGLTTIVVSIDLMTASALRRAMSHPSMTTDCYAAMYVAVSVTLQVPLPYSTEDPKREHTFATQSPSK